MDKIVVSLKKNFPKYMGIIVPPSVASPTAGAAPGALDASAQGMVVKPEECRDAMTNFGQASPASGASATGTLAFSDQSYLESGQDKGAGYVVQIVAFPETQQASKIVATNKQQLSDCPRFDVAMDASSSLLSIKIEGAGEFRQLNMESEADETASWSGTLSMRTTGTAKPNGTSTPASTPSVNSSEVTTVSAAARSGNVAFIVHGLKSEDPQQAPTEDAVKEILNAAVSEVFPEGK